MPRILKAGSPEARRRKITSPVHLRDQDGRLVEVGRAWLDADDQLALELDAARLPREGTILLRTPAHLLLGLTRT